VTNSLTNFLSPTYIADFYKVGHRNLYPDGTEQVFSNLTARKSRIPDQDYVIFYGLQYYAMRYLIEKWNSDFFNLSSERAIPVYQRRIAAAGLSVDTEHLMELHQLGYLPIEIWALPEGSKVPIGIPMLVMWNTDPRMFWLTNFIETSLSQEVWGMITSATTAHRYRKILIEWAEKTGGAKEFVDWQGHDFSMRGMFGLDASMMSGSAHLLSFNGTDTIPAIDFLETWYGADCEKEMVGGSVVATEHSVMCMGGKESEIETFKHLMQKVPSGVLSVVSDTWDYWKVLTEYLPALKSQIMNREGTLVVRPDSGDPVKIIVGDSSAEVGSPAYRGTFELLWETFGGTVNEKGYKVLDSHIGAIYGDSITPERAEAICSGLATKGFVPTLVLGIGSYTYQYVTRDTYGMAVKATAGIVNGEVREIWKDPATDDGTKKSAKGYLAVYEDGDSFRLEQQVTLDDVRNCAFEQVFSNGVLAREQTLQQIRKLVR